MQKWEYKIDRQEIEETVARTVEDAVAPLNALGDDGWEMIKYNSHYLSSTKTTWVWTLWKRPKQEAE